MEKNKKQILQDMKACIIQAGLPVLHEETIHGCTAVLSQILYPESHSVSIYVIYDPQHELIEIALRYADAPEDRRLAIAETMNVINTDLCIDHFAICPVSGRMVLLSGMFLTERHLDKAVFSKILNQLLQDSYKYFRLIQYQYFSEEGAGELMDNLDEKKRTLMH